MPLLAKCLGRELLQHYNSFLSRQQHSGCLQDVQKLQKKQLRTTLLSELGEVGHVQPYVPVKASSKRCRQNMRSPDFGNTVRLCFLSAHKPLAVHLSALAASAAVAAGLSARSHHAPAVRSLLGDPFPKNPPRETETAGTDTVTLTSDRSRGWLPAVPSPSSSSPLCPAWAPGWWRGASCCPVAVASRWAGVGLCNPRACASWRDAAVNINLALTHGQSLAVRHRARSAPGQGLGKTTANKHPRGSFCWRRQEGGEISTDLQPPGSSTVHLTTQRAVATVPSLPSHYGM